MNFESEKIRFVFISDTHNKLKPEQIPPGDILIHCGDFTKTSTKEEYEEFKEFLIKLTDFKYKIVISGNHDLIFDQESFISRLKNRYLLNIPFTIDSAKEIKQEIMNNCIYLENTGIELFGIKIFGSPFMPEDYMCPFSFPRNEISEKWKTLPTDIDILITHTPPYKILDTNYRERNCGCRELLKEVTQRIKPKIHAFGHIHESYGLHFDYNTLFINAAVCTKKYEPINKPIVIEWEKIK